MEKNVTIHLREPNTLARYLCPMQRLVVESLKITGKLGRKDFEDVIEGMCISHGYSDENDNYIPDKDSDSPALKHLDMGEATYVDGERLPSIGFLKVLDSCILPQGIKASFDGGEYETGPEQPNTL